MKQHPTKPSDSDTQGIPNILEQVKDILGRY